MGDRLYSIEIEVLDSVGSLIESTEITFFVIGQTDNSYLLGFACLRRFS
ncbi:MAG: hypothetical protein ACJZ59_06070 [Candidatus Thalassarchaeaceae archaeon]